MSDHWYHWYRPIIVSLELKSQTRNAFVYFDFFVSRETFFFFIVQHIFIYS